VSHAALTDAFFEIWALDPLGMGMMFLTWNSTCWMRNPTAAASKLISKDAIVSPEELYRQVGGESGLVTFQHNPPFWKPAENVQIPMLLLAGEKDAVVTVEGLRKSAAHYKADFRVIPGSAHNLMMEKTYLQTAEKIDAWLNEKKIA
jgi:alpha-beta hydrolase superfamily lysophospholipase